MYYELHVVRLGIQTIQECHRSRTTTDDDYTTLRYDNITTQMCRNPNQPPSTEISEEAMFVQTNRAVLREKGIDVLQSERRVRSVIKPPSDSDKTVQTCQ